MVEPQLDADDVEEIVRTRLDFMAGRSVAVTFRTLQVVGIDPFTEEPSGVVVTKTVPGVVSVIEDQDQLLRMGGRVRVGDTKVTLFVDDAVGVGLEAIRRATVEVATLSGILHEVDVLAELGLGRTNRFDLALVRL